MMTFEDPQMGHPWQELLQPRSMPCSVAGSLVGGLHTYALGDRHRLLPWQHKPIHLLPHVSGIAFPLGAVLPIFHEVVHDRGISERGSVAEVSVLILGDLAQDAAHDLARARLR